MYACNIAASHLQCVPLMWLQMVTKAEVPNYLVVAIDTQLRDDLTAKGYNVYYKDISVSCSTCDRQLVFVLVYMALCISLSLLRTLQAATLEWSLY